MVPAVGQGALGIEIKENNRFADDIIQSIHDEKTFLAVSAERSFLRTLEGGCQVPIGGHAEIKSNGLFLTGMVGSVDGQIQFRKRIRGSKKEPEETGRAPRPQRAGHLVPDQDRRHRGGRRQQPRDSMERRRQLYPGLLPARTVGNDRLRFLPRMRPRTQ